jgi:ABC-2 type transport system permease protein
MMLTILRIQYLRLRNNPLELLLVFVMPVLFFSIFAMIFSRGIAAGTEQPVRLGLAVPERTAAAEALLTAMKKAEAVECTTLEMATEETSEAAVTAAVERAQNSSRYDLIVQLPLNFDDSAEAAARSGKPAEIRVITDGQNAMAVAIVTSRLKEYYARRRMEDAAKTLRTVISRPPKVTPPPAPAITAPPPAPLPDIDLLTTFPRPPEPAEIFNTPSADRLLDPQSSRLITIWDPPVVELQLRPTEDADLAIPVKSADATTAPPTLPAPPIADSESATAAASSETADIEKLASGSTSDLGRISDDDVRIELINPQADGRANPRIAMYAAGIAVLFLLFACTGHAGTMLDEAESGTLDRILASHAGLLQILGGKWLGTFLVGCLQLTVMFVFADVVFGIELQRNAGGFVVMAVCTSAATSGFALLLATLCRSRAQLNAAATVIILSMSAIGGSMIPRFVMSERMKELGRWSFNAWALDGFQKVFWFRTPLAELRTEVAVLLGSAFVMAVLTLIFSGRWKRGV